MQIPRDLIQRVLEDPDAFVLESRVALAEHSLLEFVRLVWPVLEPAHSFVEGRVVAAMCEHLEAVTDGRVSRLLINVPPGFMKSLLVSVIWPAWVWGPANRPWAKFVCASYAMALSVRDNLRCRRLIESDLYQRFWGDRVRITDDQNAKVRFENSATGFKLAVSVGGPTTGERGDFVTIDDPHNVVEGESEAKRWEARTWFKESLPTRTTSEKTAMVMVMQRIHAEDCSSIAVDQGWDVLCLPMRFETDHPTACRTALGFRDWRTEEGELLWPELFPESRVAALEVAMGAYARAGQLQQRPAPRGGGMFKRAWFEVVEAAPAMARRVVGWDLAGSKDKGAAYTAGVKLARASDGSYYVESVTRGQWSPMEVERAVRASADASRCEQSIPQDPGQAGLAQKTAFARLLAGRVFTFSPETGSKEDRARPVAAQAEAGMIRIVRAPWNEAFLAELESFPMGSNSDQVDALSRAFARLSQIPPRAIGAAPITIG